MEYEELDPILVSFAKRYGLHIFHRYKDAEVRNITIVDDGGNVYGMGIWLRENDTLKVGVGYRHIRKNRKSRDHKGYNANLGNLLEVLETAYAQVVSWIIESGNTRTPS